MAVNVDCIHISVLLLESGKCFLCFCWITFFLFPVEQKIFVLSFGNIVFQLKMFETENS